jgi:hypothetical protein
MRHSSKQPMLPLLSARSSACRSISFTIDRKVLAN